MKKYIVELITEERSHLNRVIQAERMAAHKRHHARMLLKLDQGPEEAPVGRTRRFPKPSKPRLGPPSGFAGVWSSVVSRACWSTAIVGLAKFAGWRGG